MILCRSAVPVVLTHTQDALHPAHLGGGGGVRHAPVPASGRQLRAVPGGLHGGGGGGSGLLCSGSLAWPRHGWR